MSTSGLSDSIRSLLKGYASIEDFLHSALRPHGVVPRKISGWYRFPAVWRGSKDFNIAMNDDGIIYDHTTSRTMMIAEFMEKVGRPPIKSGKAMPSAGATAYNSTAERIRWAREKWASAIPLNEDEAPSRVGRAYLKSRGIPESVIDRVASGIRASTAGGAMLVLPIKAPLNGYDGNLSIIGIQRIFLSGDGNKRQGGPNGETKMMLGSHMSGMYTGHAIIPPDRERMKGRVIGICEGYETGLAIHAATGMSMFVAYDAGGMEKVDLKYLSHLGVEEIVICGDNDPASKAGIKRGQQAAATLAWRIVNEAEVTPRMAIPEKEGTDWLDDFVARGNAIASDIIDAPKYTAEVFGIGKSQNESMSESGLVIRKPFASRNKLSGS